MQKAKDLLHHHHHEKPETSREAVEHGKPMTTTTETKKPLSTTVSEAIKPSKTHETKKPKSSKHLHESGYEHKHKHGKEYSPEKLHKHKHKLSSEKLGHEHKHGKEYSPEKLHKHKLSSEKLGHEHTHTHPGEVHVHEHQHKGPGKYGAMYREGTDPLLNREVGCETHSQGGVIREMVSEAPVVKEILKPVELHKVQPVIHREREQREIRHVVEPHKEFQVGETEVIHRERDINLGVRREPTSLETTRSIGHAPHIESTREIESVDRQHQDLPVRVEEHVHKVVEEHVHPVIYKEVLRPKVLEETQHIYETVKESPIETYKVKDIGGERGLHEKLIEAEREFFAHESARGVVCPIHHREHPLHGEHIHEHRHVEPLHAEHKHEHVHTLPKEIKKESPKLTKKKSPKLSKKKSPKLSKKKSPKLSKKKHSPELHKHDPLKPAVSAPYGTTGVTRAEPIIGHHQNIGGHHLPSAVIPTGQNTAYDAALAQMPLSSRHSERDKEMMRKMDEKHMAERNARRSGLATDTHHNVV